MKWLQLHTRLGLERPAQLVALAIGSAKTDRVGLADAEGNKVVEDGAGRPGLAPDLHHVVHGEAGFDRGFGFRGVDVQIPVEEEVARHADA